MQRYFIRSIALFTVAVCAVWPSAVRAQQPAPTPSNQDEVIRITSELMQTDVTVVDKKGSFVEGLKREQFELRVNKKPRAILFFDRVKAGSANEEAQLAAARGALPNSTSNVKGGAVPLDRGRTVFFYVDDLHLGPGSMPYVRKMLLKFLDQQMGQNDDTAIVSPSGQIGFLQQLTDNKDVLRLAVNRLNVRFSSIRGMDRPPMTEYQALAIETDRELFAFLVDQLMRDMPGLTRPTAEEIIRARARVLKAEGADLTLRTLTPLESLINTSKDLPGRKLIVFISDGFFLDPSSHSYDRLRRVTSAAARAGVVIYTIDARGLIASLVDPSTGPMFDPGGRGERGSMGEIAASQDGLHALAKDTGGRPMFNNNDLSSSLTRALKETATYYLIAWRPEPEDRLDGTNRVEIRVVGQPDLIVRVRPSPTTKEIAPPPVAKNKPKKNLTPEQQADEELGAAVGSRYPVQTIPTSLMVGFLDDAKAGLKTIAAMQSALDAAAFKTIDNKPTANIGIAGVAYDLNGKVAGSFRTRVTVTASSADEPVSLPPSISYQYEFKLKPGLYQVRVAARDEATGRTGNARQWIEIPDLTSRKLVLGTLLLGERTAAASLNVNKEDPFGQADLSIERRFARTSDLRFLTFIYNASSRAGGVVTNVKSGSGPADLPDLAAQVHLLRDDQPVLTTPSKKIEVFPSTDLARIPYAADMPLSELQPGRYVLQVTIVDRIAKTSATQRTSFVID